MTFREARVSDVEAAYLESLSDRHEELEACIILLGGCLSCDSDVDLLETWEREKAEIERKYKYPLGAY